MNGRPDDDLVLLPLGGMGEIGMNCYLYGLGNARRRRWLMVDLGVKFGDDRDPGIDVILLDPVFIESERRNLAGIVLTHAHEDHIGVVTWLWPRLRVPVFCTPFAAEMLRGKLEEAGLTKELVPEVIQLGGRFEVGPFGVEFVSVTHSIPEPNAVLLRTSAGTVLHTGDWKIDRSPTIPPQLDEHRLREIGGEGVDALVCDSTNVLREGHSPSESQVSDALGHIISEAKGRVAVTTFASHVGRISSVARAARAADREVVVAGRAMRTVIAAARTVGLLREAASFREEEAFGYLPPGKVVLLCTGSQGEPRAAIARIADGTHPSIALEPGDVVVFSSKTIPGNEIEVAAVQNGLAEQGVDIITSDDALVHTSGHPRQEELKALYGWVKPRLVIPMHGEMRHLARHAEFSRRCGVPQSLIARNGDIVRIAPGPGEKIDEAPVGRLHVDGSLIVPSVDGPARFRRKLSFVGVVAVSIVLDDRGALLADPGIVLDGIPAKTRDGSSLEEEILNVVEDAIEAMPRARRREDEPVAEMVRIAVRRTCETQWGKRPVCKVIVHRV